MLPADTDRVPAQEVLSRSVSMFSNRGVFPDWLLFMLIRQHLPATQEAVAMDTLMCLGNKGSVLGCKSFCIEQLKGSNRWAVVQALG